MLVMRHFMDLSPLVQELYHELHALDRFEQDYQRKIEELQSLHLPQKGLANLSNLSFLG